MSNHKPTMKVTIGDLPSFQRSLAQLRHSVALGTLAAGAELADPVEISKGWFDHEFNPDHQARMMATAGADAPVLTLRQTRLRLDLTQTEVARRAGVSVSLVSIAERLTRGVSAEARARIRRALDSFHA